MARTPSLGSMSVEELLKLRDEVGRVLSQKAVQLEQQLARLGGEVRTERRGRGGSDMLRARARYGVLVVGEEIRPLGETVGLLRAHTSGESPDSTQAGVRPPAIFCSRGRHLSSSPIGSGWARHARTRSS